MNGYDNESHVLRVRNTNERSPPLESPSPPITTMQPSHLRRACVSENIKVTLVTHIITGVSGADSALEMQSKHRLNI